MGDSEPQSFDVAVVGGGAAGLAAALAAARCGLKTALFAPPATFPPGRTAALMQGSVASLERLGVWAELSPVAAPLCSMRIVDATKRLIRAPETTFHASEIGLSAFGFNVGNGDLVSALRRHAESAERIRLVAAPASLVEADENGVRVMAQGTVATARLVVAADGAQSLAREAAGIAVRRWAVPQSAIVATFAISRGHDGTSTEFHTETGPFTLVPLPGDRVSLVWVDRTEEAERTAALEAEALSRLVESKARSIYGNMRLESAPAVFPLKALLAQRFAARRTMLVGEAAHQFPPIGAQGLNLGFRDVEALRQILTRFRADPGQPAALDAFHAARQGDIRSRTLAVDLLNRSLLTGFLPVQAARGLGLTIASSVPVIRRALMRQGLAAVGSSGR